MAGDQKSDLRGQLEQTLQGRVCLMGVGNTEYGDDAFGVRLARLHYQQHAVRPPRNRGRVGNGKQRRRIHDDPVRPLL